ncbi:hypothetical protein [Actinoallomurus iriomotensis]|uniref:Uncharacterized protein n=1 Tax=Actinoallomurus iriomotensis TaxID=478107 RepID=A0A9W6W353_9ACTN|nr:hypothetical protein [Actinoallomurus iriomotensis]GLY89630.1 hypothetical protein Airi02_075590 [Actinoallomurus iriomotensis]
MALTTAANDRHEAQIRPGAGVILTAVLVALFCLGFAVVNVVFESTDRFADGTYSEYVSGLTVMNWLVVGLKVLGAVVALLSIADRPRLLSPGCLGVLVWGAFALLSLYVLGSLVEAVGIGLGLMGSTDQLTIRSIAYVLFFLLLAAGYGVLTVSYQRRHGLNRGVAILGILGAPVLLGALLVAVPTLLTVLGVMPGM